MKKRYWLGIVLGLLAALVVVMAVIIASHTEVGLMSEIETGGQPLSYDTAAVPQAVIADADAVAAEIFGDDSEKSDDFAAQLVTSYAAAKDHDFLLIFSSGGWGWSLLEESPGLLAIFEGIETELEGWGYTSLTLEYLRTESSFTAQLDEFWEMLVAYPEKAEVLAARLQFLTDHLPDVRVIMASESTGAIIIDTTMVIMVDNPRVYSIQMGPPFWHTTVTEVRSLIMIGNGIEPDTLSEGFGLSYLRGCYQKWFGMIEPSSHYGTEPHIVVAPGHDYWWQYPVVRSQIIGFLEDNFAPEAIEY